MSDRIAVFNEGKIVQLGTPREIYENPTSKFVSEFVGQTNKISAEMARSLKLGDSEFNIRPEDIHIDKSESNGDRQVIGKLKDTIFVGATTRYLVSTSAGDFISTQSAERAGLVAGDQVILSWSSAKEHRTA
jgi:putative spermidine/putrescine transport system ATP-binding protein